MDLTPYMELFEAAWRAANGQRAPFAMRRFEKRRSQLNPFQLARLDDLFRRQARFAPVRPVGWPARLFAGKTVQDLASRLRAEPDLSLLAMHAPDGILREQAVLTAPISDAAALTALLLRCNDWAAPVQQAAFKRLNAILPELDQTMLGAICLFVIERSAHWQRGGAKAADVIKTHPAWPSAVKAILMTATDGPLAKTLRQLLRDADVDWALPELAMGARSAFVRAVATETLLDEAARWLDGHE